MTNWKSMFFRLVELARPEKTVNDEAEIIGWATHEDGQHYPIHAAQGGGGSLGASSGGGSYGGEKSSQSSGGSGTMSSGGGGMKWSNGTEKQQKYAEKLKSEKIKSVESIMNEKIDRMQATAKSDADKKAISYMKELKGKMVKELENRTDSATEWINKKQYELPTQIFKEAYQPFKSEHQQKIKEIYG